MQGLGLFGCKLWGRGFQELPMSNIGAFIIVNTILGDPYYSDGTISS